MAGLDDGARQPRHADAVGPAFDQTPIAVRPLHLRLHRLGIFGAEEEDVADLDAARGQAVLLGHFLLETRRLVLILGRRIWARPLRHNRRQVPVVVGVLGGHLHLGQSAMAEHLALAGLGQDDEFMAQVAADRPGIGAHRDRLQPHAVEGAQIGDEHLIIGVPRRLPPTGRRNRRPSSGIRGRASRRNAGGSRRGTSTGCDRDCAADRGRISHRRGRSG